MMLPSSCGLPERDSWASPCLPPPRIKGATAMDRACAAIEAQARTTAFRTVKERALPCEMFGFLLGRSWR
jgi:hypothetical protein